MFDQVSLIVKAGKGGDGAISFRREKFVPYGGPDGGDGGKGGDVIVRAVPAESSLRSYRQRRSFRAGAGETGRGRKKHGKDGQDVVLAVPPGTLVSRKTQIEGEALIADLEKAGQEVVVARGGRGGLGNVHFSSPTNQAPQIAQGGEPGEEDQIVLEMRLIADVGIIGYPNAGKSTLLAAASAARPKIGSYPFTTLEPVLGVVEVGAKQFVLAEIPGLIEEAHLGRGLGHDFLRHSLRTRILLHLVDGSAERPVAEMMKVNAELALYDSALMRKPQLVAVNKIDLAPVRRRMEARRGELGSAGVRVHFISAGTGEGVPELMAEATAMLEKLAECREAEKAAPGKVFHPRPKEKKVRVQREGDVYVVEAPGMARLITRGKTVSAEVKRYLRKRLDRPEVSRELEKAGVRPGARVRCGDIELEW